MSACHREDSIRVGIMADSHGDAAAIRSALRLFRSQGCGRVYHLGDICDSLQPHNADACVEPLQAEAVIAIRGNNDHSLLANQKGRPDPCISKRSRHFLENLPLKASFGDADLVHSLPPTEELGLASRMDPMQSAPVAEIFKLLRRPILFRGHSHNPELMWCRNDQLMTRTLRPAERVDLTRWIPCIITCGALTDGHCMIWEPARREVVCRTLPRDEA